MSRRSANDRGQASPQKILALFLGVMVAGILLSPIVTTVNDNTGLQAVGNQSVTANPGTYEELDGYDIDENSETVWWFNSTSSSYEQVSSPDDYEMDYQGGRIKVNSSSTKVADGDDLKVSYDYQATDPTTTLIVGFVPVMAAVLILGTIGFKIQEMMR